MALTNEDIAALGQLMDNLLEKKLEKLGLVSSVPSPTNGHVNGAVKTQPVPVVTVAKTPTVSAPQVKETNVEPIPDMPMTSLLGVTGQALVDLAKLGAGEYGPQGNMIFGAMREHILNNQNPPTSYKQLSAEDKTKLNTYITKKLTERVVGIRRILKAQAKANVEATPQSVVLELPEEPVAPKTPILVLDDEDRYETINPKAKVEVPTNTEEDLSWALPSPTPARNPESIGPVGDAEVRKLVADCREKTKIGQSPAITLSQWAKLPNNQKRPGIARKILAAAAKELNVPMKGGN